MSINSKMTALADEIRILSGTTETMGLDDMAMNISDANDEVVSQADLITQIVSAIDGKASGGGSSSIEAWTGIVDGGWHLGMEYHVHYLDETFTPHTFMIPCVTQESITIASGTFIVVTDAGSIYGTDIEVLDEDMCMIARPTANGFYITLE